jgi:hypothetical protein
LPRRPRKQNGCPLKGSRRSNESHRDGDQVRQQMIATLGRFEELQAGIPPNWSHIHRKKPKGRAMPETTRRANNAKSKIRSRVEHVFAEQKDRMGLFIRTIGIVRAMTKIGMANLVYNIKRFIFLRKIAVA